MDREKLAAELLATFVEELEIHVAALNRDMLALERVEVDGGDAAELLHSLFRTTHTIKGASRAAGAAIVEQASHRIEDTLTLLREKRLALSSHVFELLFAVTDAIADAGERLRRSEDAAAGPLAEVVARLEALAGPRGESEPSLPAPSAQPATTATAPMTGAVRIGTEKLDDLVAGIGELSVLQARLAEHESEIELLRSLASAADAGGRLARAADRFASTFRDDRRKLSAAVAALDADIKRVRMVPF
ncbi:MAG TPA: Hpt domain-containing protein, partial [Labilithrix sp.]|nr:Hpt domain-containing protein [Labilithrix sp.]